MQLTTSQTKVCPFCAETILAAAVKCRYCGEFLNTERAKALMLGNNSGQDSASEQPAPSNPNEVLFSGSPTLWVITGTFVKCSALLLASGLLIFWHIEHIAWLHLLQSQQAVLGKYRLLTGLLLGLATVLFLFYKSWQVKMTHYEVSADRIEFGTGIFDRKVDNLDMFRIIDIKLRRSFLDCIVGVGTVLLTTTDKSHPEFVFEKVRDVRALYDVIKKASLSADRRTNVVHME
jgi:membrane protein YdbS with pleckstrin-like domain